MKKTKSSSIFNKGRIFFVYGTIISGFIFAVFSLGYFAVPSLMALTYVSPLSEMVIKDSLTPPKSIVQHIKTPEPLKAIYMSQCVVGTPSFRSDLVKLIDETELNAVLIDIKDYTGKISFPSENPILKASVSDACGASDMKDFIKSLHDKDIYVIGRITVFQDPYYTKLHPEQAVKSRSTGLPWKDHKGLAFIDVSSKLYWDYVFELSKESYEIGFDEINYDYIRYPSDGHMADAVYVNPRKADAVEEFWKFLYENVKPIGVVLSADLFGMTMTNTDDLGIGQQLEKALPYFDYIAPMVYPSHYPNGFNNLGNPNLHPYEVIYFSMIEGVKRTLATTTLVRTIGSSEIASTSPKLYTKASYNQLKLRPWLQDFDYGGNYDVPEVKAQIKATYDSGLTSWMLWAPSNRYTRGALETDP